MEIYPKSKFLKLAAICTSSLGIFPWNYMFGDNQKNKKIYATYSRIMLIYYGYFTFTSYVQLGALLMEDTLRMDEISKNLSVTLMWTMSIIRQTIMKLHSGFVKLVKYVIDTEKQMLATSDEKVLKIYNEYTRITNVSIISYLLIIYILLIIHAVRPFYTGNEKIMEANQTYKIRALPLSTWMPFDEQAYYWTAYIWTLINSIIGALFVMFTDVIMFPLIIYPVGQLKILNHILREFDSYKEKVRMQQPGFKNDHKLGVITFKACIDFHRDISKYVDHFNESMSIFMIIDFLQSSFQFATVIIQLLTIQFSLWIITYVGVFIICLNTRLFIYYYYSNEVIILSESLPLSVWQSNWYEESNPVKIMMKFFIARTRIPLKFTIGPFGVMSLATYIAILKASYSYITLLQGTK